MKSILEQAKELLPTAKKHFDYLHRNAELSFCEYNSRDYIVKILQELDIPVQIINETSVIGVIECSESNRSHTVALRADIDALPIDEDATIDGRSNNGAMHACGHDIHTSSLLGCAAILSNMRESLDTTFVLIFQQGEEVLPGGASKIIESRVLEQYSPKMVIAQHVEYTMNVGEYGICEGLYMASGDELHFTIKGIGGHAANPSATRNPIYAACEIVGELKEIEKLSPESIPTIISIGKITANGATNIIPDSVKIEGTFRTMNEPWRAKAKELMAERVLAISEKHGVETVNGIIKGYSMLKNDIIIAKRAKRVLSQIGIVHDLGIRLTTEDFGAYSSLYPTLFYRLGIKNSSWTTLYPPHTSIFRADTQSILYGIAGLAALAIANSKDKITDVR